MQKTERASARFSAVAANEGRRKNKMTPLDRRFSDVRRLESIHARWNRTITAASFGWLSFVSVVVVSVRPTSQLALVPVSLAVPNGLPLPAIQLLAKIRVPLH